MTEHVYIPGDPWAICPRCGDKRRQSVMRNEWTGQRVCPRCWEPKHPQLTGPRYLREDMAVPDARPRPADNLLNARLETQLTANAPRGALSVTVADTTIMRVGWVIGVTTAAGNAPDNRGGSYDWTTIVGLPGANVVQLEDPLLGFAQAEWPVYYLERLNRQTAEAL